MRLGRTTRTTGSSAFSRGFWLAVVALALAATAPAAAAPPWDGQPISRGLGPTYGEPWCAPPTGESVATLQGPPLALIPYAAIECSLAMFQAEATAAGIPQRMTYSVFGRSAADHPLYVAIVNALETPEQQRDYARWQQLRAIEKDDPVAARALLDSWGGNVKMPIFIEANIHGGEREGADAMMQALRDLTTTPRGAHPTVDKILDRSILIIIPSQNPDGRIAGTRANSNGFDMNRDLLVQSQPEMKANVRLQQQWLATNGLALHGYVNPTLIDALTKPHNPGLEYDIFLKWNQRRVDANEAHVNAIPGAPGSTGYRITRPVNDWCPEGDEPNVPGGLCDDGSMPGPITAEGWDDWGPFYTQTYISLIGIDGSTVEMCSTTSPTGGCGGEGRLGSKKTQYVTFYSSVDYWLDNRLAMMRDQLEIYRRGVTDADRPNCCDDPFLASRGFRESEHNWMVPYPRAYVIPFEGGGQRSDAEANRLVQWLLDNGIKVTRATANFTHGGTTYPAGSYVVFMNQAFRGLALTALSAGQDISARISQLYAPPGAWSHGLLWGADVVEIPRGAAFAPATTPVTSPSAPQGGVRGGISTPADWYSVTLRGPIEVRAILGLLRRGVTGAIAETPFMSTTGGTMPAGSLIFGNDFATVNALEAAGREAGIWFERSAGPRPAATRVAKAPKVAILVNTATRPFPRSDQSESLEAIFGEDIGFVSTVNGADSLQNAPTDPLAGFDVIYNTGQAYPSAANATARARLDAFFARGGGYIGTSVSGTNFTFLTGAGLVAGSFTQGSQSAGGGIALWNNVGGAASPITGGYPARDTLYLPSNITYFSAVPTGAVVDGRYVDTTDAMWVAGLWRNRNVAIPSSPVIVHGTTNPGSRYMGLATNPFSRQDAEREWTMIGQAAFWTTLTDEASSAVSRPGAGDAFNAARWNAGCAGGAQICGVASTAAGPAISKVQVAIQRASTGLWWNGTAFASTTPVYLDATGTSTWSYAFPASQFPGDGDYVVRSKAIDAGGNEEISPSSVRFVYDNTRPGVQIRRPAPGATYGQGQNVRASFDCVDAGSGIASCTATGGGRIATGSRGSHEFKVTATDEAGNETVETVTYNVAALSCAVRVSGRLFAAQRSTLTLRVRAFAPDRTSASPSRPLRVTLRGAGVRRAVTVGASGVARVAVRPSAAGRIQAVASASNMSACRGSIRVRAARTGAAGAGTGAALTGRPR